MSTLNSKSIYILRFWLFSFLLVALPVSLCGCTDSPLDPDKPVSLTFWHVYGAQAHSPMNAMVHRFNETVGKEQGIIIKVTSVSNTWNMHGELIASARKDMGSEELPDIFTCFPKTTEAISYDKVLDWKKYFSGEELRQYVPVFMEEGRKGEGLYGFPLARSTNLLYVSDALFEPFSRATGVSYDSLSTLEGLFHASALYHEWSGGKPFFAYDDWIQYAMLNSVSLGEPLFEGERIRWDNPALKKLWSPLARAAANGEIWLKSGYCRTAMMLGEIACGVGSSAAILYFQDRITLSDNTTIPLKLTVLPEPRFEKAKRMDMLRGSSLYARASTPEKEYATAVFCKWLTSPDINLDFAIQGGYLPVNREAFEKLADAVKNNTQTVTFPDERYRQLYKVLLHVYDTTAFVTTPCFSSYGSLEKTFGDALRGIFSDSRGSWHKSSDVAQSTLEQMQERLTERP